MLKKIRTTRGGFTLAETAIFMGIFTILIYMITNIFTTALESQREIQAFSSVQSDGRYILSRLHYDILRAQTITTPSNLGDQTSSLQLTINGTSYVYQITNNNLILTSNTGSDQLNSFDTTVSALNFIRLGNTGGKNSVRINFTLTSNTIKPGGPEVRNYQTTFGLR